MMRFFNVSIGRRVGGNQNSNFFLFLITTSRSLLSTCVINSVTDIPSWLGIFSKLGGTGRLIVFEIFGDLTSPNSYVTIRGNWLRLRFTDKPDPCRTSYQTVCFSIYIHFRFWKSYCYWNPTVGSRVVRISNEKKLMNFSKMKILTWWGQHRYFNLSR
jgi:hypothetical protein